MGSLKVPALLANLTDTPTSAIRPAGRITHDVANGAFAVHDGFTPGGDRINRFKRKPLGSAGGVGANEVRMYDKLASYEVTPEEFGAVGNGIADDAAAIQRALDHIKAIATATAGQIRPGTLLLTPGKRYKCGSQLLMDRAYHNVYGYAVLDFSSWVGNYVRWTGSLTEFGNAYGQNGCMEGQIVIVGQGQATASVGIKYDSATANSATHIRTVGVTVINCGISFQIGSRGYNQEFHNCKSLGFGICFDWLGVADDNDERVSVFGGTFYNGGVFIQHKRPAGAMYLYAPSVDYVNRFAIIVTGKVQCFGLHQESSNWVNCPIDVTGDGGHLLLSGGWFLMQSNLGALTNFVNVGAGSSVVFQNVLTNNTNAISTPDALTPTTWATGAGRFEMRHTEPAFEFGGFPSRLHDTYSKLADGSFETGALGQDPIWLFSDTQPITSRVTGQNLQLSRVSANQYNGTGCLRVNKQFGTTSEGSFVAICIPVQYGDRVTAGFRIRTAPDRPGTDQRVVIRGGFAKLDGHDANRIPAVARFDTPGDILLTPGTGAYTLQTLGNNRTQATAPSWATHYIVIVNLSLAHQASFLLDGMWADTF